jgi:NAD(P)-dependent dehydrogenase (short-subunit alcohol dehydrogenase family)
MNSVLITGASTGIGEASAIYLARQGWRVFAGVRKYADARRLSKAAAGITAVILDVTKPNQISQAVKKINRFVGKKGLQGLVNNAGIAISGPLEFLPMTELRHQLEVNFLGQVELTQACLPLLRAGRGRVVNISSIGGRIVAPFLAPYSISKFALEAYSDGLRRELRPWKLYVTSVQAGSIDTPIWKKSLRKADQLRRGMPRRAEALYGPAMERARQRALGSAALGIAAEDVAHLVGHILITRWPRARYAIGHGTRQALWLARLIPDEWLDWLMARVLYR